MSVPRSLAFATLGAMSAASPAPAQVAGLRSIPAPPFDRYTLLSGVEDAGQTALCRSGYWDASRAGEPDLGWTALPGGTDGGSEVLIAAAGGSAFAGVAKDIHAVYPGVGIAYDEHPVIWSRSGQPRVLRDHPKVTSIKTTWVSPGGTELLGNWTRSTGAQTYETQVFRWTEAGGFVTEYALPSSEGSISDVVNGPDPGGVWLFRLRLIGTVWDWWLRRSDGELVALPSPPWYLPAQRAEGIATDTGVVFGHFGGLAEYWELYRFDPVTGRVETFSPEHCGALMVRSISADGSVVVGPELCGAARAQAGTWVWTRPTGIVRLYDLLAAYGVDAGQNGLLAPLSVSADGRAVAGLTGRVGWVATIPPIGCLRADFDLSGDAAVTDVFLYLQAWLARDPRTDYNESGTADVPDIFVFLASWFGGC